jgi:hypothetical protein
MSGGKMARNAASIVNRANCESTDTVLHMVEIWVKEFVWFFRILFI